MTYKIRDNSCCNECCDECKEPKLEILGWKCIEVDKSEEWQYVINNKAETIIKSTDWTVDVQYIEWTHEDDCKKVVDLSVACEDKKVAVCDRDTPWFLPDKIRTEWAIKMTTTCNDNWYITLSTDFLNTDEKVAVSQWCTPVYLRDAIESTSSYVDLEQVDCKLILKDREVGIKPIMKVRLVSTQIQRQPTQWELQTDFDYILLTWQTGGSDVVIPSDYKMELSIWEAQGTWITDWLDSNGFCVIPMDWIYRCTFWWCIEINSWVIAWRTYLYHWGSGSTNVIAMESRQGWVMWTLTPWITDTYDPEKFWLPIGYNIWVLPERAWLGRFVPRQSFGWTTIVRCLKGDKFCLWVKVSSSITDPAYDTTHPAEFQIQSSTQSWPWGMDQWAYYILERIAPLI